MKKIAIIYDKKSFDNGLIQHCVDILFDIWKSYDGEVIKYVIDDNTSVTGFYDWIEECKPDYLCSLDMAGFSIDTLTGNRYYNICFAKQIHIITYKKIWEYYADEAFALNLYFFLPGDTEDLRKKHPNVPNMYGYQKFEKNNNDEVILRNIVRIALEDILGTSEIDKI